MRPLTLTLALVLSLAAMSTAWAQEGGAQENGAQDGGADAQAALAPEVTTEGQGAPEIAAKRFHLGFGRLFSNDRLGDGKDRWRTGSYVISNLRGYDWTGELPEQFGSLIEYRTRSEIIAPANLSRPAAGDRRHVGIMSFGVHTYWQQGGVEYGLGADAVAIGPQTGLGNFQTWVHENTDNPVPDLSNQIENAFYPALTFEAGKTFRTADLDLRPFAQALGGPENLIRVGADVLWGTIGKGDMWLRDVSTGIRYAATRDAETGAAVFVGADVAKVFSSAYLSEADGYALSDTRARARIGYRVQGNRVGLTYGLTYLSPEFKGQGDSQVTGSIQVKVRF